MQENSYNYKVLFTLLIFTFFLITRNKEVLETVSFSISIWKDNLFPTLFPFFVISNLLIQYGFVEIIGDLFKSNCIYVLFISLFSGFPSGAINTVNLLNNNKITLEEANYLLTFTHYANPIFIIGFIGNILGIRIACIILISHVLSGLLIGLIFKPKNSLSKKNIKISNTYNIPIGTAFNKAIKDSLNTIFMLLGIITIFLIFSCLINTYFNLSSEVSLMISGILEMTQGINKLLYLDISLYFKTIITTLFISFGGLSVHMQVLSIISLDKIKYKPFLIARIIHSILAIMLVSILYFIIH